jgi:RNA polymerase sigma-70 factor (ECF subfamily)
LSKLLSFDLMENQLFQSEIYDDEEQCNKLKITNAKKIIHQVINSELTPRQREILILYFIKNYNTVEISKLLSVNKSTVSRTLNRAINNIKKYTMYYHIR